MASISAGLKSYLKPGMRGVPLLMTSRMTSALPPSVFMDSTGAYCGLTNCGLVWQTRHDWLNSRRPSFCCWSIPLGDCADAAAGHGISANKTIQARRFMRLPPDIFMEAYARAAAAE